MPEPSVALESTVFCHGLPAPENLETAFALEDLIRAAGAVPRTIGIVDGEPVAGLSHDQIHRLASAPDVRKVSLRDLPVVIARRACGATTVSATMWIAHRSGIRVFSTGGIGGVHRSLGGRPTFDVSADLEALASIPMVVVCAGAKSILDLPATREVLETRGITVVGYGTDELPAFFSSTSGLPVDVRCDRPEEVAAIAAARWKLGMPGAVLVTVPAPEGDAIPQEEIEPVIQEALREAETRGLHHARLTPFLLDQVRILTGDRSLRANVALLKNNAQVAAAIALALGHPSGE
ncbi:MAG TPA: pseudouridine-5'-phosphate glycosidase [Rhodothermales bacterium]|nr:pseudouridine-5'-phosphate glycosidase [Rhodothermales bacterium]